MKSELVDTETDETSFPALYERIGVDSKFIVLFNDTKSGMIINTTDPNRPIGYFSHTWITAYDKCMWKRLPAIVGVILSN